MKQRDAPVTYFGVPGNYYSNEKYMASMFGFPHFGVGEENSRHRTAALDIGIQMCGWKTRIKVTPYRCSQTAPVGENQGIH